MKDRIPAAALQVAALALGPHAPEFADPRRLRRFLAQVAAPAPVAAVQPEPLEAGRLLSPADAARRLGISRRQVGYWLTAGKLPARRLGHRTVRISEADLLAFIASSPRRVCESAVREPARG